MTSRPLRAYAVSFVRVQRGVVYAETGEAAFEKAMREGEDAAVELAPAAFSVSLENSIPQGTLTPDLHVVPLTLKDVADRVGITYTSARNYQSKPSATSFPPPDGQLGRTNFWWPETIDAWNETRPKIVRSP